MLHGVLFDIDGVLIDSSLAHRTLWTTWGERHGLDVEALLAGTSGEREIDTVRRVAPQLDVAAEVRLIEELWAAQDDTAIAYPGAAELLGSLDPGRWGTVTSGPRGSAVNRLRLLGLPLPQVMVCAEDVRHGKPHPEPYALGAQLLGIPAGACIVIEDAPIGIAAARAAGCYAIAVTTGSSPAQLRDADEVVPDLLTAAVRVRELLASGSRPEAGGGPSRSGTSTA